MRVLGRDLWPLLKDTWEGMSRDKVSVYAAQMAYSFFFALFPLLLFAAALLDLVVSKQTVMGWLGGNINSTLPAGAAGLLRTTVEKVVFAKGAPGILSFGLVVTAWSGSSIFGAFRQALNAAYEVRETRPWWKQYALQLGALVVAGIVLLVATVILLDGGAIVGWVGSHIGLGHVATLLWSIAQIPVAIAAVVVLLWLLYLYLPNCRSQNRKYVLVGAVVATALWIAATLLFRLYVQSFGKLNPAYGAVGAIMVLLTWMYYSSYVLLAAGELASKLEHGAATSGAGAGAEKHGGRARDGRTAGSAGARAQAHTAPPAAAAHSGTTTPARAGGAHRTAVAAGTPESDGHRGIGALLRQFANDAADVLRRELALFRLELGSIVRDIGLGAMLVATGAALALLGGLALIAGIILLAGDQWLPADLYWVAALIVMVVAGVAALILAGRGRRLAEPRALAPTQTIDTLKEDAQWTRDQLTSSGKSA